MDKRLDIRMNASRRVVGVLRGYDQFMNLVLEDCEEITKDEKTSLGTVMMRGNSVMLWECLDKIN
jgi:small nuclear ribonucleoprotein G